MGLNLQEYIDRTFIPSDVPLTFGTGGIAQMLWETADANANELLLALPAGGAVNVPVFVIGDQAAPTIINRDLGFFNGITQPLVAVVDSDKDSWVGMGFIADDQPFLRAKIGANAPVNAIRVNSLVDIFIGDNSGVATPIGDVYILESITSGRSVYIGTLEATAGSPLRDSNTLALRAKYWDGAISQTWDLTVFNDMTASGGAPASSVRMLINALEFLTLTNTNGVGTMSLNNRAVSGITLGAAITGNNQNVNAIGHIGLANSASDISYVIVCTETFAAPAVAKVGLFATLLYTGDTSINNVPMWGVRLDSLFNTGSDSSGTITALLGNPSKDGAGNLTAAIGTFGLVGVTGQAHHENAMGTITALTGFLANNWGAAIAGGIVTNACGMYIKSPLVVGTVTNAYGIYIENITGAVTINRAVELIAGGMWMSQIGAEPASIADRAGIYAIDVAASCVLGIHAETAAIVAGGIASTHKIPIRYNGATLYLMASNV